MKPGREPNDTFTFALHLREILLLLLIAPLLALAGCAERVQPAGQATEAGWPGISQPASGETETTLEATLKGGPDGDPRGTGQARVTMNSQTQEVCYEMEVHNIADPTMAHIHVGDEGETGGVVIDFNTPENGLEGCVSGVENSQIQEIRQQPGHYYVNVHNTDFPAGAIRGQLSP